MSERPESPGGSDRKSKDIYLLVAGWMIIITGVLALLNGSQSVLWDLSAGLDSEFDIESGCGVLILVLGAVAVIGGISALRGKGITLALIGAVCGAVSDGAGGFFLGIGAIVLIFLSHQDL